MLTPHDFGVAQSRAVWRRELWSVGGIGTPNTPDLRPESNRCMTGPRWGPTRRRNVVREEFTIFRPRNADVFFHAADRERELAQVGLHRARRMEIAAISPVGRRMKPARN